MRLKLPVAKANVIIYLIRERKGVPHISARW
jgi:hypothetical protein